MPQDADISGVGDDSPLIELGVGIDSVAKLELLVALEREFSIRLDEAEITPEFFESVSSMSGYIADRL